MKKIFELILGAYIVLSAQICCAADKFDVLPDLPEPLGAAQASSVSTTDSVATLATQPVGQEPNFVSMIFSLVFVILLIYATGIVYTKLNKFGIKTLKSQQGSAAKSSVSVISTTPLGSNKTLHVVELDGKRMLIGASASSIHLIKDLGNYPPCEIAEGEYSKIEIPNIRIPKIEIPKIEIPGFTKVLVKPEAEKVTDKNEEPEKQDAAFEISDIYEVDSSGEIIDELFHTLPDESEITKPESDYHKVDPDDFVLYKKYL